MKTLTSSRIISLPIILVLCCVCALILTNTVSSEGPKNLSAGRAKEAVRMFDVGFGSRTFNFQLGRETENRYLGAVALQQAIQSAQLQPRTMVSDDFNGDGMGDLVIGYANGGGGVLSLRQGNLQAIAPSDPSVFQAITQGRYPSPFLPEVKLYQLPEAPDFLQFGDFNSDGYADVMTAARGSQRMYLLAGDGRGNLGDAKSIEVPGVITEMRAATQQLGTFTQLAVGLFAPGESRLAVYNETQALVSGPESYSMTGEVTALAFDQLDGDGITDLAAATSSEVVVIHGRLAGVVESAKSSLESTETQSAFIERQNVPFVITGLATGDFVFDRNHQREIALLSGEGTVYLSSRGTPDTRPFTKEEKQTIGNLRRSFLRDKIDMETLTAEINKLIRPNRSAGWNVTETIPSSSAYAGTGKALFQTSKATSLPIDDLLIGDGINNRVQLLRNEQDAARLNIPQSDASKELSVAGAPIAAVSMRLSVNVEPGMVLLGANQVEPTVVILAPNALFTVNSTADLPDTNITPGNACLASNGLCTLRAAVMQSNHTGGSNTIMVPDGTYTLTLGPPDDEANTGGATEQSGDLDIFSWDLFGGAGEPILTAVGITGGTRDGCIIQMGTLSPILATNVPSNKERILEVNDVVVIGFHRRIAVTLTNLTMQNGHSPSSSGSFRPGGAIYYDGSDLANTNIGLLTLSNVKLSANTSVGQGGGVWAGFGSLTVNSSSIVRANISTNAATGGIAWTGGNTVETQGLTMANSTVGGAAPADGNQATDPTFGAPGGVDARGGLFVTISGTTIQNNVANTTATTIGGGGIQINSPTVAISTSNIINNKSKGNAGGIYSSARNAVTNAASTLTLTTVNVTGNQADSDNTGGGNGGGIFNFFGTAIIQTTSHVDGNSADNGGGIFNAWTGIAADPTAGLTVQSGSTIGQAGAGNGNSAKNNGGSIAISQGGASSFGPITLNSLTFTNNTANSDSTGGGDGGAIFLSAGTITSLNACTFDSNVANGGTGDAIRQTGGTINGAGTLSVNGGDSISLSGGTFTSTSGILNLTGDLLNSGGTFTHNSGTLNMNGAAAQTIGGTTAMTFNNLTINNSTGVGLGNNETVNAALTLTSGALAVGTNTLTLNGAVTATGGSLTSSATGTVNYNQGSGGQAILAANYGNLTFSNQTKTLPNGGTVQIRGTFTTGAAGGHTVTGSTVEFNGTSAQTLPSGFTTYNNVTLNNAAGVTGFASLIVNSLLRVQQGTFTNSSATLNNVQIDSGSTLAGVSTTIMNVSGNWSNAGTFTPNTNTVIFNGNNNTQTLSGATSFANLTSNHTGTGSVTASGSSLTVTGLMRVQAGTFTSSSTFNNVQIDSGTTLASDGSTMNVSGNWTNNSGTFTPSTGTVNFNGGGAQTLGGTAASQTFNNFTVNKGGGALTGGASTTTLNVGGNLTLTAGTFAAGTMTTMNVTGSWANNGGSFTPGAGTVNFNGGAGQAIGGTAATTFNNLTNSNGNGLSMTNDNNVNAILALSSGDITVASTKTLTQPVGGSSTGTFDVNGRVQRNGFVTGGAALSFGNPFNTIQVTAGTAPANIVVDLARNVPGNPIGFPTAVQRTYTITPSAGGFTGTLRLHYRDAELNGNTEAGLIFRRFNGTGWAPVAPTSADTTNNWLQRTGVTQFSPWTFNSTFSPTGSSGVISGQITDNQGHGVEGAVVRLDGTQNRKFITDAEGFYRFENVETGGFYIVTPSRVNYTFSPSTRSFSQLGESTEATFGATVSGQNANPLDTPEYFVRQQYLDFLGREPDETGFNFWSDQIIGCSNDAACISRKRENVSAAYFHSIEFQNTGGLVDRLYRVSFGRQSYFSRFMLDTRFVGLGVRVGDEGWEARLLRNKEAFLNAFVNRPEFHAAYDGLDNSLFVDTLISHTGVSFTVAERDALANGLANGTQTRAEVLRSIAEDGRFVTAKFNEAFVMMEYFGYLRRDPDAVGFAFWLGKLNSFGGNFEQAEMVKAFIVSGEYRNRFPR